MGGWKVFGMILLGLIVGWIALRFVLGLISWAFLTVLGLAVPVAIVGGVGYLIYRSVDKKALRSGRRILP